MSVPNAPTNVVVMQNLWYSAEIAWTRPTSGTPTGYTITANPGNIIKTVVGNYDSGLIEKLLPNTLYTFSVVAYNTNGNSPIVNTTTPTIIKGIQGPTNLVATLSGKSGVLLTWTREIPTTDNLYPGITLDDIKINSYTIYDTINGIDFGGSQSIDNLQTSLEWPTSYLNTSPSYDRPVKYAIRAFSKWGYSDITQTITSESITTIAPGPKSVVLTSDKKLIWDWNPNISNNAIREWIITATPTATPTLGIITKSFRTPTSMMKIIDELVNNTTYTVTVGAKYVNDSLNAEVLTDTTTSSPVLIGSVNKPSAPRSVQATNARDKTVDVSWIAPVTVAYGGPIISYTVTSIPALINQTTTSDSIQVPGLTNGTSYKFTVIATNAAGNSPPEVSNSIIPILIPTIKPNPPTNVKVDRWDSGGNYALLSWVAPNVVGDSPITQYKMISNPENHVNYTWPGELFGKVYNLNNSINYTFTVMATNTAGLSIPSAPSGIVPDPPTSVIVTADDRKATISWTAPVSTGDSAITSYTVVERRTGVTVSSNTTTATISNLVHIFEPYLFIVFASNSQGNSRDSETSNITLPIRKPDAPTDIKCEIGNMYLNLSWTKSYNGGSNVMYYTIQYSSNNGTNWTDISSNNNYTSVTNLTNNTSYIFRISATNQIGTSNYSSNTPAYIPFNIVNAPIIINSKSGNQSALIYFTQVNTSAFPVTKYRYTLNNGTTFTEQITTTSPLFITNLTNGVLNNIKISAYNANGWSNMSNELIIKPDYVPDAPKSVTGTPRNEKATISWTVPDYTGSTAITSYKVTGDPGNLNVTTNGLTTTKQFNGLTNGTSYNFTVVAINSKGVSYASTLSNIIPLPNKPDAPTNITCLINNKSLNLSWDIPDNGGATISSYTIQYSSNNGTNWTSVSSQVNNKSVTNLINGTSYIFRISATNSSGTGDYSLNTPAFIPLNLVETPVITNGELGNGSVSIFFTQANTTGLPITKYRYTLDNGVTFTEQITTTSPLFIKNLTNGVLSNIKISAYTQIGWSPMSNSLSITPVDDRSEGLKTAITNLSASSITALKNQLFTDISSLDLNKKIQKINSLALDISGTSANLRVSTLLNIALNIGASTNSIKSNLNNLMIESGLTKNVPYVISDPTLVNKIISDVPTAFKNANWEPTSIAVVVPDNNFLTIDLNQPNFFLLFVPDVKYTVNAKYSINSNSYTSSNTYSIVYNRTDTTRTLTINGSPNKKTIGDTIIFWFPNTQINFKINMLGSPGGEGILLPGGTGDPHILTVNGHEYMLPHDEKCYLLYDNNIENDRVIVTAKCWFLPDDIKNNSKFKNVLMTDTTFFKYINFYYNGENLTFDMETLSPVKYTNMKDLTNNYLKMIKNNTMIKMSELIEDKCIFKCHYSKLKLKRYNINFDGQSRMIELANDYKFKISFDLNCADHRNEIKIVEANFNNSTGALISEDSKNCIEYFIPPKNVFSTIQKFTS